MSSIIAQEIVIECKMRLLGLKQALLERARFSRSEFSRNQTNVGDEIDQTVAHIQEHTMLANQERIRRQLLEIESALGRIEQGIFGICEETFEPIEVDRLLAIPYTRLSIEGAEIREATDRRYARA